MKRIIPFVTMGLVVCALCAAQIAENGPFVQEGIASWYGVEFEGRPTASGEMFSVSQFTAAHPVLPFGTMLRVTNKNNNRSVIVRVNDRGPFVSERIIDVSKAAAEQLDMIRTGTAPVMVERVEFVVVSPDAGQVQTQPQILTQPAQPQPTVQIQAQPQVVVVPAQPQAQPVPPWDEQPAAPVYYIDTPKAAENNPVTPPPAPAAPVYTDGNLRPTGEPEYRGDSRPAGSTAYPGGDLRSTGTAEYPPPAAGWSAPSPAKPAVLKGSLPGDNSSKLYRIQVGSYTQPRNAVETFEKLKNAGLNPAYEKYQNYYRVVLSGIKNTDVRAVAEKLGQAGFEEALIKEEN